MGIAALVAGCLVPVALAAAGDSAATTSTGGWVSTVPPGSTTASYLTQVDTADHFDVDPAAALSSGGHGVIAWRDIITGDVVVSEIQPGLPWGAPQALAQGTRPAVAIDPAGDITVVWVDPDGGIDYGYQAAGSSTFVTGQIADGTSPQAPGYRPQVVMDSGGNAWVVWSGGPGFGDFSRDVYGAYLSASTLAAGGVPSWSDRLASASGSVSLATSPSGSGVIAAFPSPRDDKILTFYAPAGSGSFSAPAHEVPNPGPGTMNDPVVALTNSGVAVLAWDECGSDDDATCDPTTKATIDVASATAAQLEGAAGAAFTSPQTVPLGTRSAQYRPHIAANDDEVALAWEDVTGTGRASHASVDGATEPLADLGGGNEDWQQLDQSVFTGAAENTVRGPLITIDDNSNVTLAWEGAGPGAGDSTVNTATASACATSCSSVASVQLDSQADADGRLSLAGDPGGDALISWTSYAPSGGVIPTAVAGAYDPGPALSNVTIPASATSGTASGFSIQATDTWSGIDGPINISWNFGDGTTATGSAVTHTYTSPGTYTVTVTASTRAASSTLTRPASSTLTRQINVSTPHATLPAAAKARLSDAASWGSRTGRRSASAVLTVPALSCAGNTAHRAGQALGVRLWGSHATAKHATALADFAGVKVECRGDSARYRPSFTVANVRTGTSAIRNAKLRVTPGDLLRLSVTRRSGKTLLSITDLSTPNEAPAVVSGPSLAPYAGWQVGAFPIAGVTGPFPTLPSGFTKVMAGGTGIASLHHLVRSRWHSARVSPVGRRNNQLSVVYRSLPKAPRGGNLAAAAHGMIRYRRPGQHGFANLQGNTPLPGGTLIDATGGTVQLSNAEPHGQNQSFTAWGGDFRVANNSRGATTIRISGTWAPAGAQVAKASSHKKTKRRSGSLWANAHGNFTTKGNYGAAAVLGTKWLTRNLKHGTLFKVAKDRYDQNDRIRVTVYYPHRHTVVLTQGQSLLAPAPMLKPKTSPFAFTLVGVKKVNGRYNTAAPGYYELVLLSYGRPYYVDAAVAPQQPSGGATSFYPDGSSNGEPRWYIHFTLKQSLTTFQLWNIGIQIHGKLYVVPLRLK